MNIASLFVRARPAGAPIGPAMALGTDVLLSHGALVQPGGRDGRRAAHGSRAGAGRCVALVMRNSPAYAELFYACWHAGLAAVPVNAKLHPKELAYIIDHSQARVVFASDDHAQDVASAVADAGSPARVIVVGTPEYARLAAADPIAIARAEPGRPRLAVLHERHDRPAQGRDALARQLWR